MMLDSDSVHSRCADMVQISCSPSHDLPLESPLCSIVEAGRLESSRVASSALDGLVCSNARVGGNSAFELIGKGEKAEGEHVDDGRTDDNFGLTRRDVGGANDDALLGMQWQNSDEGEDFESDESGASDQQGSDDHGNEDEDDGSDESDCREDRDRKLFMEDEEDEDEDSSEMDEDTFMEHAMEVYAPDSFSLFRQEYEKSSAIGVELKRGYHLAKRLADRSILCNCYKVHASCWPDNTVDCCCNHFAITGMLCSHAIAVLKYLDIDQIPDEYLLKWRMKSTYQSSVEEHSFPKRRKIHPSFDDCINRSPKQTHPSVPDNERLIWTTDCIVCDDFNHFGSPILIHAKKIYLAEAYELFREEHKKSECLIARVRHKFVDWRGLVYDFEVYKYGYIDLHKVHAEAKDGTIKCSCRKFETSRILCAHALAVFYAICIVKIPHQYLVPKLLKDPNVATDENIHGPEYREMLECAILQMVSNRSGRTLISRDSFGEGDENEESLAAVKVELGDLPEDRDSKKRKASTTEGSRRRRRNSG